MRQEIPIPAQSNVKLTFKDPQGLRPDATAFVQRTQIKFHVGTNTFRISRNDFAQLQELVAQVAKEL